MRFIGLFFKLLKRLVMNFCDLNYKLSKNVKELALAFVSWVISAKTSTTLTTYIQTDTFE